MKDAVKLWDTLTLREIGLPSTPNVDPSNYPGEIFELYSVPSFSLNKPEIVPGNAIGSTKQLIEPNDILLCKIVPHLVRVWCVPGRSTHRQIASGEWIVVRPDPAKADKHYLRYALIEPGFRSQFMKTVSGVGGSLMRARPKAVGQIRVPLPAKVEQLRIVAKLDRLFKRSKRAREELTRIPRLVDRYKQAILAAAFEGELTADWRRNRNIPEAAPVPLDNVLIEIKTGPFGSALHKSDYVSDGVPVVNPMHIGNSRITPAKNTSITRQKAEELADFQLREGDVVIARRGEMGRCAVVNKHQNGWLCGTGSMILRPSPSLLPDYLQMFLSSPDTVAALETGAVGSTMVNLYIAT